ncbi:hypothetical protein DVH24_025271 [Malus domestica]|uniref:ABC transporter domain-containing protein n=1 Tax=Malus domestica TaxID=3750 RepID=A0A498HM18_MALDO|nr:hypothetical protein DVH24_025271 [Malus domestica]
MELTPVERKENLVIEEEDEEVQLQWAAIERLPTYKRCRTALFDFDGGVGGGGKEHAGKRVVDVTKLKADERHLFIEKLIKHIEHDNLRLLQKLRERIDRVNVKLPTVEVRYKNLFVEAECDVVQGKPLPTLWNTLLSFLSVFTKAIWCKSSGAKMSILSDVSGIIKPSRLTLLLGTPGCGKTTLLLALAGKLDKSLKVAGEVSYNGYKLDEFVPQKTSAYISEYDLHIPEMTVRETIDFSARCQGVGSRAGEFLISCTFAFTIGNSCVHLLKYEVQNRLCTDTMMEVIRREKEAGIVPDSDIDTYMKAISVERQKRNLQTDYVLKILGLDTCSDTMLTIIAFITMTVFIRTQMAVDLTSANFLMGSLFYTLVRLMTNGVAELSLTVTRLPVVYKQRGFYLYPAWAYCIPASLLKVPFSLLDSALWTAITYYVIGFSPEITRFFCQFLMLFALHQSSTSMCRLVAVIFRTMVLASTCASLPSWLRWGFWCSPMTYAEIGTTLNEFLAPRWQKVTNGNTTLGNEVLTRHGLNFDGYFYWISVGALFAFTVLFDLGFVLALTYQNPPKMSRAIISGKRLSKLQGKDACNISEQSKNESTPAYSSQTVGGKFNCVKNVVATGRTIVCTIHQPSIDIFESFNELILMKTGGQIIYSGALGHNSSELIEYFERIPNVPKIKDNYNPATWMLEVTSASVEAELGLDFASIYKNSTQYRDSIELVKQLSEAKPGSKDLHFPTHFPQNSWVQFKACLWKQHLSYWRSTEYNLARFMFMIAVSVMFGVIFWQKGKEINNEQDLMNILGSTYIAVIFLGVTNCSGVLPYIATERTVLYRERFAGMYSSKAYSFAQVVVEIPYTMLQAILYVAITYPTIGFFWSPTKVFWYLYATFCTFLYFVYLGMLIASLSTNLDVASILATAVYTLLNLFAGFLMPGPKIPKWWIWCYWICPTSWSLNGLLTSQYGDMSKEIVIFEEHKTVGFFLQDYFGFHHDRLGLVALVLIAFPIVFASLFAYCIGKFNFQRR